MVKYTFVAGGATNDLASLYVDPPTDCNEPAAATVSTSDASQTDAVNLDGVCIRQGTAANAAVATLDGIARRHHVERCSLRQPDPDHQVVLGRAEDDLPLARIADRFAAVRSRNSTKPRLDRRGFVFSGRRCRTAMRRAIRTEPRLRRPAAGWGGPH